MELLIKRFAEQEGITEQFKKENQMAWVDVRNSIRNRIEEIINTEIIYI